MSPFFPLPVKIICSEWFESMRQLYDVESKLLGVAALINYKEAGFPCVSEMALFTVCVTSVHV